MKTLLITLLIISTPAFAIPNQDLIHLDLIDLSGSNTTEQKFAVQYPGLGNGNHQNQDCLVLNLPGRHYDTEKLEKLSRRIHLADGAGILFNTPNREINTLEPQLARFGRKTVLKFELKDLGTYVTGLSVRTYSPYISFAGIVRSILGEKPGIVALQFLRGCRLQG